MQIDECLHIISEMWYQAWYEIQEKSSSLSACEERFRPRSRDQRDLKANVNGELFVTYPSMSIQSGQRYTMTNEENGLALDLFESHDNSVIGSGFHGAVNQQVTNLCSFYSFSLIRPRYPPVDHREGGRWSVVDPIGQYPEALHWLQEYSERRHNCLRHRQASALGHRGPIR